MASISRDTFCKAVNKMMDICQEADYLSDKYSLGGIAYNFVEPMLEEFVSILEEAMNDKEEGVIDYFIYESDFGRDFNMGDYVDENGNNVDLSTPGTVYDYLVG